MLNLSSKLYLTSEPFLKDKENAINILNLVEKYIIDDVGLYYRDEDNIRDLIRLLLESFSQTIEDVKITNQKAKDLLTSWSEFENNTLPYSGVESLNAMWNFLVNAIGMIDDYYLNRLE